MTPLRLVTVAIALSWSLPVAAQDDAEGEVAAEKHDPVGPIVMMSAGVLVVGAGLGLFVAGAGDRDAVESAAVGSSWADYRDRAERGPIFLGVGQIMMAAGVIVAGAGLTWLILALADANPDPFGTAGLEVDVGPFSLNVRGRF